jgi:hypothetical protein
MTRTTLARALPLAAVLLLAAGAAPNAGDRSGTQVPRFAPGATLEATTQVDLLAMPPAVIHNIQARMQNRVGTLQRGARVKAVSESEVYCRVAIECQDGKVRVEGWIEKAALRPAPAEPPQPLPR